MLFNPFVIQSYVSDHYFCDREDETALLLSHIRNNKNVALISPRRLGKTGLIHHVFEQDEIKSHYYTFLIDIYATKNFSEFVHETGKKVLSALKPRGRKVWEQFLNIVGSLRSNISFDINGVPELGVGVGDIKTPETTLEEIFHYLEQADKPCVVAIDEFQTIAEYPETKTEARLRTLIQNSRNCRFVFAGSRRHVMTEIFLTSSRPFYQSTMLMQLSPIPVGRYVDFAQRLFHEYDKSVSKETIEAVYRMYDGITWYMQVVLNTLFSMTDRGTECSEYLIPEAVGQIIGQQSFAYESILYQLPVRQKDLLIAICKEGKASNITSAAFQKKYRLTASSVQSASRGLLERDLITSEKGVFALYDRFFAQWLLGL